MIAVSTRKNNIFKKIKRGKYSKTKINVGLRHGGL